MSNGELLSLFCWLFTSTFDSRRYLWSIYVCVQQQLLRYILFCWCPGRWRWHFYGRRLLTIVYSHACGCTCWLDSGIIRVIWVPFSSIVFLTISLIVTTWVHLYMVQEPRNKIGHAFSCFFPVFRLPSFLWRRPSCLVDLTFVKLSTFQVSVFHFLSVAGVSPKLLEEERPEISRHKSYFSEIPLHWNSFTPVEQEQVSLQGFFL